LIRGACFLDSGNGLKAARRGSSGDVRDWQTHSASEAGPKATFEAFLPPDKHAR
jgi:hypothetical protein